MCSIPSCTTTPSLGFKLCDKCRKTRRDQANARRRRLVTSGLCTRCSSPCEGSRCSGCKIVHNSSNKIRRQSLRDEVMNAYGGYKCACCGETGKSFLTIDHINNDGNRHRKELGSSVSEVLYTWLKKHNYPPDFQILCWNCNVGKKLNGGVCPHVQV